MNNGKRDEVMIANDRAKICELLARGYRSRKEITDIINQGRPLEQQISEYQISNDIDYMKKKAIEKGVEDYLIYRDEIINELTYLQKIYFEGYDLSRRNKITIESIAEMDDEQYNVTMTEGTGLSDGENVFERAGKVKEEQRLEGNPAFLQGAERITEKKMKLYNVEAPNKIAMTDVTGQKDADGLLDMLKQKMEQLSNRVSNPIAYVDAPKLLEGETEETTDDTELR